MHPTTTGNTKQLQEWQCFPNVKSYLGWCWRSIRDNLKMPRENTQPREGKAATFNYESRENDGRHLFEYCLSYWLCAGLKLGAADANKGLFSWNTIKNPCTCGDFKDGNRFYRLKIIYSFFYLHFKYCAVSRVMEVQFLHWQRKPTKMELSTWYSGMYIFWISSFHPHSVFLSALRSLAFISATTSKESSITSATL